MAKGFIGEWGGGVRGVGRARLAVRGGDATGDWGERKKWTLLIIIDRWLCLLIRLFSFKQAAVWHGGQILNRHRFE